MIVKMLDISPNTVINIKKRYFEGDRDYTIHDKHHSAQPKKYDVEKETKIIALTYTNPPEGNKRWTTRLLAETLREKEGFESILVNIFESFKKKNSIKH